MADDGEGSGGGIVGFLFGNVNERGELEDNGLLDEDSRRQLGQLHDVLGSYIGDLKSEDGTEAELPEVEEKAPDAVDYGDIDELCDEQTRSHHVRTALSLVNKSAHGISPLAAASSGSAAATASAAQGTGDDDDYDDYDTPEPIASVGQASGPSPASFQSRPVQPKASLTSTGTGGVAVTNASLSVLAGSSPSATASSPVPSDGSAGKPDVDGFQAKPSAATVIIKPKTNFIPSRLSSLPSKAPLSAAESPSQVSTAGVRPGVTVSSSPAVASSSTAVVSPTKAGHAVANGVDGSTAANRSASDTPMDVDEGAASGPAAAPVPDEQQIARDRQEILVLARKYYPDFHPDKVIRFSRLFGPGRASSIPRTWKDIAVPRKRSPRRTSSGSQLDESQSEGERDESAAEKPKETGPQQDNGELVNGVEVVDAAEEKIEEPKKPKRIDFWVDESGRLRFGCRPSKQERDAGEDPFFSFRLFSFPGHISAVQIRGRSSKSLDFENGRNGTGQSELQRISKLVEAAAWRHGPAALIYDMVGLSEDAVDLQLGAAGGGTAGGSTNSGQAKKKRLNGDSNGRAGNPLSLLQQQQPHQQQQQQRHGSEARASSDADSGVAPISDGILDGITPISPSRVISEDAYSMVTQMQWEDEIIWKDEDIVARGGLKISTVTANHAGLQGALQRRNQAPGSMTSTPSWKPRTPSFPQARTPSGTGPGGSNGRFPGGNNSSAVNTPPEVEKKEPWYSIFPVENDNLLADDWSRQVIWDTEAIPDPIAPMVLKLNSNDENLVLGLPEDSAAMEDLAATSTGKKESKKSKVYGLKKDKPVEDSQSSEPRAAKDMFNLSNDDYYSPQLNVHDTAGPTTSTTRLTVPHSRLLSSSTRHVSQQTSPCTSCAVFHRHPLKLPQRPSANNQGFKPVTSVTKHKKKKSKEREKERAATGGGEVFFMRELEDLSSMDGDVVLLEVSEEHPPLLLQRGMAGRIVNYYKRKPINDTGPPKYDFGENAFIQQTPFLGSLAPGQSLQSIECSLYRTPIYRHNAHPTDFILIKTHDHYYLREYNGLFIMGQICPKVEVPGPNSKRAGEHVREFLKVFIFRLFRNSTDNPRRLKMETIRKAFPSHSESSVRKRLKLCADFKRTGAGNDCGWWVLKEDFQLPSEEKMRAMMTPEHCCAFYSMLAAEQRLKDAGFGSKSMFAEEDEEDNQKLDDEVLTAPWHTTRNFVAASKGKCQLAVFGNADPTGCGEGFSYARVPNKPMQGKEEGANPTPAQQKKAVTGTDADLRRLSLKNAREVLKKDFGYTEEELNKLGRWAVIDALRTHSTQAAKEGKEGMKNSKFARGSRFSMAEHQERYREDCQRIFDIQNRVLASEEVLSTDEGSSSEDEGKNLDKLASGLDNFLTSSKTTSQLTFEQEEMERRKLHDLLDKEKDDKNGKDKDGKADKSKSTKSSPNKQDGDDTTSLASNDEQHAWQNVSGKKPPSSHSRTFQENDKLFVRTEIVTHPEVIEAYLRVAGKKDKAVYAEHDEHTREAMRREKRRIQEQLRRIKRNEEKERARAERRRKKMEEKELNPNLAKMRCGACGGFGHMKTNKHCPKYIARDNPPSVLAEEPDVPEEAPALPQDHLVKVEGTKVSFDRSVLEQSNRMRQDALRVRIPRELIRRRRRTTSEHCDYLQRHARTNHRRRTNPHVDMGNILEKNVVEKMRQLPDSYPFHTAVPAKQAPDYYTIVKEPMHLQLMKENIRDRLYRSREEFMNHVDLMVRNSVLYNGNNSPLTQIAESMRQIAVAEIAKSEKQLSELERQINPLLSDDPMVTYSCHLESVTQKMKAVPDSWPFYFPVQTKDVPDYYTIVKQPMDVQTLQKNCQEHFYHSREEFLRECDYCTQTACSTMAVNLRTPRQQREWSRLQRRRWKL
ncbi:LOW QUALITY PROTEIN: transcription initiation factor TFIID subunit 1-like [Sycon ciliatum]|uniref:LOW QUALITY PROTEIN: transcription initiation factor TFIID subunit 1-like n=1 Tax=Sycon ciliatum TaxID=27933 RepID=UPI0031F65152